MFTTRFTAKVIQATKMTQISNLCVKPTRCGIHDIKLPHHENHIAASEYTRLQRETLQLKAEIKEKDTIISTLRAQKRNQQNQTTNAQTTKSTNNPNNNNNTNYEEKIEGTVWTGGMTDTDGFGAGWRGQGWDKPVERKEGRMRELMRGMTGEERERYDHL